MKREELINDITNKQVINQVIKQHLTDFVIEYNTEVSKPKGPWEKGGWGSCVHGWTVFLVISEQGPDLWIAYPESHAALRLQKLRIIWYDNEAL